MTATLCVLPHRTPAAAANQLAVCEGHLARARDDLTDIDTLIVLLPDMALPGPGPGNARGRAVHSASPAVIDALCATDLRTTPEHDGQIMTSITNTITTWTRALIDTARLSTPTSLNNAVRLLSTHIETLTATAHTDQLDPGEALRDIHDAARMLRHLAGETPQPVGRHTGPHPDDPSRDCNGRLFGLQWSFGVTCQHCGETWDGHQELQRLGLVLDAG